MKSNTQLEHVNVCWRIFLLFRNCYNPSFARSVQLAKEVTTRARVRIIIIITVSQEILLYSFELV